MGRGVGNGFLVLLLVALCTSEGLSSSNQSSSAISLQEAQASLHVPEVAPPTLKDVQQVMLEASEKGEGHAAEEVLKELLEKVAEAAMGQMERAGEAKGDEAAEQGADAEDALGDDTEKQVMEEKKAEGKDRGPAGGGAAVGKEQVMEGFKDAAEEGVRVVKEKGATAAEETTAGVEPRDRDGVEVRSQHPDTGVGQEERGVVLEERGREGAAQVEDIGEQAGEGAAGMEPHEAEETPEGATVALGEEQENVEEVGPVEQPGGVGGEPQEEELHPEETRPPSEGYYAKTTNAVVEDEEEEGRPANHAEGPGAERKPGHGAGLGGAAGGEEPEDASESAATGGDKGGDAGEVAVNAGGEARGALERSGSEDGEAPPLPGRGAEASAGQGPESRAPAPSPSPRHAVDPAGEKPGLGNEIITPSGDLSLNGPAAAARPTLGNLVTDVLAQPPRSEKEGEAASANGLVEDTAATTEPGLEAWKIGAICAAAFLIAESAVIAFYVLKRRDGSDAAARQRAREEGRVDPEEATGGDCSDDAASQSADGERIATLDPSDASSTPAHGGEQQEAERATAMSDCSSDTTQEPANAGPEPNSSQDLRTSVL